MTWAKLDDAILDNPKIARAGVLGFALHVAGITWCSRNLSDGFIPYGRVACLLDLSHIIGEWVDVTGSVTGAVTQLIDASSNCGEPSARLLADSLVACGLWHDDPDAGGYRVHDYLKYNPSKAQVLADREKSRSRVAKHRGGNGGTEDHVTPTVTPLHHPNNGSGNANVAGAPVPVPVPVPTEAAEAREARPAAASGLELQADEKAILEELQRHPSLASLNAREVAEQHVQRFRTRQIAEGTKLEWVLTAIRQCAEKAAGADLDRPALARMVGGFIAKAGPPRERPPGEVAHAATKPLPMFRAPRAPTSTPEERKAAAEGASERLRALVGGIGREMP